MNELNTEQRAAVESSALRKLVVAGPGSGKTKTLVAAVAARIRGGVAPSQVVCITFTNAGAREMKERLAKEFRCDVVDETAAVKWPDRGLGFCGTLHAFLFGWLRKHGALVGLPEALSVLDGDAVEEVLAGVMGEMGVKCPLKKVVAVLNWPNLVEGKAGMSYQPHELAAKEFHARLRKEGLLTFETILHYGERLVSKPFNGNGLIEAWPYKALFVDEVQDSSPADWRIYDAMPCRWKFLVGDPDQAIYGFRGGDVTELVDRREDDEWDRHTLESNYRSGVRICQAAQALVEHNAGRVGKQTAAARTECGTVEVHAFENPAAEQCFVMEEIVGRVCKDKLEADPTKWSDMAILCRTNFLAGQFADFLRGCGIPVAERKQARTPADWRLTKLLLTVLANPYSDFAVYRYLVARYGKEKADAAKHDAALEMKPICKFLADEEETPDSGRKVTASLAREGVSAESRERVQDACHELSVSGEWNVADLLIYLNSGEQGEAEGEGVTVGTVHSVKGREFAVVFVCGMEEGTFPSGKAIKADGVAEERRLAFVAMTRAKDRLHLTRCEARPESRGPNAPLGPMTPREPSRFIKEAGL